MTHPNAKDGEVLWSKKGLRSIATPPWFGTEVIKRIPCSIEHEILKLIGTKLKRNYAFFSSD